MKITRTDIKNAYRKGIAEIVDNDDGVVCRIGEA